MKGKTIPGMRISNIPISRGELEEGHLYLCHEEQEGGPTPYIEVFEDGVLVGMGRIIFIPFK
ncbi:MAG: hypothetical protein Q8O83_01615 [bacterium]|nr:hypothetical protein [bacterium]